MMMSLVLMFFNPRSLGNKVDVVKDTMTDLGVVYAGISESHTFNDSAGLTDAKFRWDAGTEGKPKAGSGPSRGMGALIDRTAIKASIVETGTYVLWHRVETTSPAEGGVSLPLFVGVGYFPDAQDTSGHTKANKELLTGLRKYRDLGHVVFGGDLNAHTGLNGDTTPVDAAGVMLLETVADSGMLLVNAMGGVCSGGPTRVQVQEKGIQQSTLDYVMCSPSLAANISSLVIDTDQMDSDHRPLFLTLNGLTVEKPVRTTTREVWDISNIPCPPDDWSWVIACREQFGKWLGEAGGIIRALEACNVESQRIADILDWSFQKALDEVAAAHLGTKHIRERPTPGLDAATKLLVQQRHVAQDLMWVVLGSPDSTETDKVTARKQFLAASNAVKSAAMRRRELAELALFREVEAKQGNSKLFWSNFKRLRGTTRTDKSPPPVAENDEGEVVTDPVEVLNVWRKFSAAIASANLEGTEEEGKYDDEYKRQVEDRLELLKRARLNHPILDRPITVQEVWAAVRKMKLGKAPGEDGILTDILKTAADAVGTSKMRWNNTVIDSLCLLFNFVLDREVWPERWGTGVIFPLHKADSRLDPSNFRPITLLSIVGKLFGIIVNSRVMHYSEAVGAISDEQGGFRKHRGCPDQILIFREILASRKERKLPTFTTFVDVRKAYDTVWREKAYVAMHDAGINGKLWRQLQKMHSGLTRRVMHPLGFTDPFDVLRGVAQGAVESPWVYSIFIDGLAQALKRAGHGIMIAGRRVPLLMYADDIVLLASTQQELKSMNKIVTDFARHNRFEYNGKKSGVMVFNTSAAALEAVKATNWTLSGKKVNVVDAYTYLGAVTTTTGGDWNSHALDAIARAKRRSNDLLYMMRYDRGMRPRTGVTLWQSLVRPILEYASEIWSGQIPKYIEEKAETVQLKFLRGTLGLHKKGSGVSNEVLRAEVGCERLRDRWTKLRMGYWRRVFAAPRGRLLRDLLDFRRREFDTSAGKGWGSKGWVGTVKTTLDLHGMGEFWANPEKAGAMCPDEWKDKVYDAVNTRSDAYRAVTLSVKPSASTYISIKEWGPNPENYSFSSGEVDRLGQHVPERYLDDRSNLKGTRLKMLCRLGCLPLMDRVGREAKPAWPRDLRTCAACNTGRVEDVHHFVMECPKYEQRRTGLMQQAVVEIAKSDGDLGAVEFATMQPCDQLPVLLGKRFSDPAAEDRLDRNMKRFLSKCWNLRSEVTGAINDSLFTSYGIYAAPGA
jgi:hypothetical protein